MRIGVCVCVERRGLTMSKCPSSRIELRWVAAVKAVARSACDSLLSSSSDGCDRGLGLRLLILERRLVLGSRLLGRRLILRRQICLRGYLGNTRWWLLLIHGRRGPLVRLLWLLTHVRRWLLQLLMLTHVRRLLLLLLLLTH